MKPGQMWKYNGREKGSISWDLLRESPQLNGSLGRSLCVGNVFLILKILPIKDFHFNYAMKVLVNDIVGWVRVPIKKENFILISEETL